VSGHWVEKDGQWGPATSEKEEEPLMEPETGKRLEQLWYENNNHLPMAVLWFSGEYSARRDHRALVLRFVRRYWFFGPITAVVMQPLSMFKNKDGTYNLLGERFVNQHRWHYACYYRIGDGFYRDSTQEALDMWHRDRIKDRGATSMAAHEVDEGGKRDIMKSADSRSSEGLPPR